MSKVEFRVQGMTCGGCERSVQKALMSQSGVNAATADRAGNKVTVEYDPAVIERTALAEIIIAAGYQVGG